MGSYLKGQIYRLYTNTSFQFWGIVITVLLTLFGIFKDDIFKRAKTEYNNTEQTKKQIAPAVQDDSSQIQHKLNSGSSSIQTDTTKT